MYRQRAWGYISVYSGGRKDSKFSRALRRDNNTVCILVLNLVSNIGSAKLKTIWLGLWSDYRTLQTPVDPISTRCVEALLAG
jgi:hypothetical protein